MKVTTALALLLSTTKAMLNGDKHTRFTRSKECGGEVIKADLGIVKDDDACRRLCRLESDEEEYEAELVCCQFNQTGDGSTIDKALNKCALYSFDGSTVYAKDKVEVHNEAYSSILYFEHGTEQKLPGACQMRDQLNCVPLNGICDHKALIN